MDTYTNNPGDEAGDEPVVDSTQLEELPQPAEDDNFGSRSPSSSLTEADVQDRRERGVEDDLDRGEDVPQSLEDLEQSDQEPLEKVARQVLDGKWGKGQERRMKLSDAGYDPNEVEDEVTRLLNPSPDA